MTHIKDKEVVKELSFAREEIGCEPDVKSFRVVVRAPRAPEKKGGIYLPDQFKDDMGKKSSVGRVVAIGPISFVGETQKHYAVELGDWVWYSNYERQVVSGTVNCTAYFINDDRILARVKEEDLAVVLEGGS